MTGNDLAISIPTVKSEGRPTAETVKVPDTSVVIAYPCNSNIHVRFHRSIIATMEYDRYQGWDNLLAEKAIVSGANISKARNELVAWFLDETDGEWLWFIDTDMVFEPDTLPRLLCAAQVAGADVIGGLCCMVDDNDGPIPTIYQLGNFGAGEITRVVFDFEENSVMQVAATGGACLLVKREVLETIRAKTPENPYPWFCETVINGNWVSEDIHFCLLANSCGHPVFVDCTTQIGHAKGQSVWYPKDIKSGRGFPVQKNYVIIPVKNKLDMTASLVRQLREQGNFEKIIILDNGSNSKTKNWLESQARASDFVVMEMPKAGIHEMWNAGIDFVIKQGQRRNVNVAILNNDLKLGPDFLKRMQEALRSETDLVAVSGNYDGRVVDGLIEVTTDICANRYDGTGGFAGFAFMARGEWFQSGYKFPTECKWWYGDNDLITASSYAKGRVAIAGRATVEHIGGGGQTGGDWSDFQDQLEKDRVAYEQRWESIARAAKGPQSLKDVYEQVCNTPSDINEHLPTLVKLVEELDAHTVIELGVRSGVSTIAWLYALTKDDREGKLWSVDIDAPPRIQHPSWTFTRGDDLDPFVLKQLPDEADIVFVDTVHTYQQTIDEIEAYASRVKPGGCMVFHDSNHERFDHHDADEIPFPVRQAIVDRFEGEDTIRPVASIDSYENNHGLTVVWFE